MTSSPALDLPYLAPAQALKHITHNEALQRLDRLTQMRVARFDLSAPPDEQTLDMSALYWTGPTPSGDWAGQANRLAFHNATEWRFIVPRSGFIAVDLSTSSVRLFDGSNWQAIDTATPDQLTQIGINTASNTTNRLSVASDATLLTHDGTDHRVKINRQSSGDTASIVFQTDYAAQAEIGLTGSQDFTFKTSPDGQTFRDALSLSASTGDVLIGHADGESRLGVTGNFSVEKIYPTGESADPAIFEFTASGTQGTPYTLSRYYSYGPTSWQGNLISAYRARGEVGAPQSVGSGDSIYTLNALGHDGTGFRQSAQLSFQTDGAPTNGYLGGKMVLRLSDGQNYAAAGSSARVLEIRADRSTSIFGSLSVGGGLSLASVTVGNLPSASPAGTLLFVSDASGGAVPAFADGTDWRSLVDGSMIAAA